MENSPLFKAHQAARKAVKLSKQGLYTEAALCHLEAATYFQEISLKDSSASRSLEEQSRYHKRQAQLAQKLKEAKEQREAKVKKAGSLKSNIPSAPIINRIKQMSVSEIRRNFDEADSLLTILSERQAPLELKEVQNTKPITDFCIRPKNDGDIIEELQTVNMNLRILVDKLLNELKITQEEKLAAEKKLAMYEAKEKSAAKMQQQPSSASLNFIMQLDESPQLDHLPDLAPLETPPSFDFS